MELVEPNRELSGQLRLLPVHLIATDGGVVIKRGRLELRINGDKAADVIEVIQQETDQGGATEADICGRFAAPDRAAVANLVHYLKDRRILVPVESADAEPRETAEQVFYWHFGKDLTEVERVLGKIRLAVLGINCISRQLARTLQASGFEQVRFFDVPLLRNERMFDDSGTLLPGQWPSDLQMPELTPMDEDAAYAEQIDCVIAGSDYGSQHALRRWNELCVERGIRFIPIVLKDLIGQVGPLVIPGETACLECLRLRQNSNLDGVESSREVDREGSDVQWVTGFHPAMASILADVAVMELSKLYAMTPQWHVGTLVEVNLLTSTMSPRKVLKLPRCPVCSSLQRRSSATATRFVFLPGNRA